MNLYEVNKEMYRNIPCIADINGMKEQIKRYLLAHPAKYYMLLNNENHYYTIFAWSSTHDFISTTTKLTEEIVEITTDLGSIKDVAQNEQEALEFWIMFNDEPTLFLLFNYDRGVVEV